MRIGEWVFWKKDGACRPIVGEFAGGRGTDAKGRRLVELIPLYIPSGTNEWVEVRYHPSALARKVDVRPVPSSFNYVAVIQSATA